MSERTIPLHLTEAERVLLIEALDSHEYWQLSEPNERNDGYSTIEDGVNDEIDAARALISKAGGHHGRLMQLTSVGGVDGTPTL